jgi:hypothetical protein
MSVVRAVISTNPLFNEISGIVNEEFAMELGENRKFWLSGV